MPEKTTILLIIVAAALLTAGLQTLWLIFGPCRNRTDLVFMLDDSASIQNPDFNSIKQFTEAIVNSEDITVAEDSVNVALCRFTNDARYMGKTGFVAKKDEINQILNKYKRNSRDTNMIGALEFVNDNVLTLGRNADETILIFLTDGKAEHEGKHQQLVDIKKSADTLKDKGVQIYAVGVGKGYKEEQIRAIASEPAERYVKQVAQFDGLDKLAGEIGSEICEPNYWLICVPIAIAVLFFALKTYLDYKEVSDFMAEAKKLTEEK